MNAVDYQLGLKKPETWSGSDGYSLATRSCKQLEAEYGITYGKTWGTATGNVAVQQAYVGKGCHKGFKSLPSKTKTGLYILGGLLLAGGITTYLLLRKK